MMSNTRTREEREKNLNAPMTTCSNCHKFKYATYYDPLQTWVCFDCARQLELAKEANYNPSSRY